MGCCSSVSAASKEARDVDTDQDGLISRDELAQFIAKNEKLYMMLSVNLNLPIERCQEIATEVAYQMSKRSTPHMSLRELSMATKARNPTVSEFQSFLEFLDQATGQQEFFHRTVFATFDVDGSGYIEPHELDNFLDVFYQAGSIFAGDVRLPKKSKLKKEVMKQLDTNGDGKLEFSELRTLISGGARAGLSFNENDTDDDEDDAKKVTVDDNKFGFDDMKVSVDDNLFDLDDKNVNMIDDKNEDGDDNQFDAHFDNNLNNNEIAKKDEDDHAEANQERSVTLPPRPPDARRPKSSNTRSRPPSSRSSSSPKPRSHSQSGSKSPSKSRSHSRSSSDGRSRSRSSSQGNGRPPSQSNSHRHSTSPTKASSRSSSHAHSKSPSHSASRSSSRHTHSKSPSHSSHRRSSDNDKQDRRRRTKRTDKPTRRVDNDSADSNT